MGERFRGRFSLSSCKSIEQGETGRPIKRKNGFVLCVDGGEMRRELPQNSDRSRLIIDENPALATRGDFPAKNNCFFFRINPVGRKDPFDDLTCPGIFGLHHSMLCPQAAKLKRR